MTITFDEIDDLEVVDLGVAGFATAPGYVDENLRACSESPRGGTAIAQGPVAATRLSNKRLMMLPNGFGDSREALAYPEVTTESEGRASNSQRTQVGPARLAVTVAPVNGFDRLGVDDDHGRCYGDTSVRRPDPNLGPLEKGPFTAVEVVVGDLDTRGALRAARRTAKGGH
jgi:hypothetical protein